MFRLADEALQEGYSVVAYSCVKSTNLVALSLARGADESEVDKRWVVADQQKKGRARRGRSWYSPPGNLYATLLLTRNLKIETVSDLGFVAGVSIAQSLNKVASTGKKSKNIEIELKWPNDVLLNRSKASGILLEVETSKSGAPIVAVGIGINIAHAPANVGYKTVSCSELGLQCTPDILFHELSLNWSRNYQIWKQPGGRNLIRKEWLNHAAGLGEDIRISLGGKNFVGKFETIDENFCCVIRQSASKTVKITSGDIYLGDAASQITGT